MFKKDTLFWNLLWLTEQKSFHTISEIKSQLFLAQCVSRIYNTNKVCLIKRFFSESPSIRKHQEEVALVAAVFIRRAFH